MLLYTFNLMHFKKNKVSKDLDKGKNMCKMWTMEVKYCGNFPPDILILQRKVLALKLPPNSLQRDAPVQRCRKGWLLKPH